LIKFTYYFEITELLNGHFARAIIQMMLEPEPEDRLTSAEVVQQLSVIMKPQEVMNNDYDDDDDEQVTKIIFIIKK
jgi:hypothetical protein